MTRTAKSRMDVYIACHRAKITGKGLPRGPSLLERKENDWLEVEGWISLDTHASEGVGRQQKSLLTTDNAVGRTPSEQELGGFATK